METFPIIQTAKIEEKVNAPSSKDDTAKKISDKKSTAANHANLVPHPAFIEYFSTDDDHSSKDFSAEDVFDTINSTADAARKKVKLPSATAADRPAQVKEKFATANPSDLTPDYSSEQDDIFSNPINEPSTDPTQDCASELDDKFLDPVNVSSPNPTSDNSFDGFPAKEASVTDVSNLEITTVSVPDKIQIPVIKTPVPDPVFAIPNISPIASTAHNLPTISTEYFSP